MRKIIGNIIYAVTGIIGRTLVGCILGFVVSAFLYPVLKIIIEILIIILAIFIDFEITNLGFLDLEIPVIANVGMILGTILGFLYALVGAHAEWGESNI